MEQAIKCSDHTDKIAIRLCDDCGKPFCAECLRKNSLGFYYCQNCYPALFKSNSVPEYAIPVDEKGLKKIQDQVESQINEDLTEEPLTLAKSGKYIKIVIAIGIGLLLLTALAAKLVSIKYSFFYMIVLFILLTFFYTGKYCGKRWKKPSVEWGFWLTLPIIGFIIMEYIRIPSGSITGGIMLAAYVISYFVLLLVSSYGAYVGAKSVQQEEEIS